MVREGRRTLKERYKKKSVFTNWVCIHLRIEKIHFDGCTLAGKNDSRLHDFRRDQRKGKRDRRGGRGQFSSPAVKGDELVPLDRKKDFAGKGGGRQGSLRKKKKKE